MENRKVWALVALVTGCGGAPNAAAGPDAPPVAASPERAKATADALREIDSTDDVGMKARIAASALSAPVYGLSERSRKGLDTLSSESVDGQQRNRIIDVMLKEDARLRGAFDAVCKPKYETMNLQRMDERKRLELLAASCNRQLEPGVSKTALSMGLALSVAVESAMKASGVNEPDLKIARALVHLPWGTALTSDAAAPTADATTTTTTTTTTKSTVSIGAIQVHGQLTSEAIRKVVQGSETPIRWCYEQAVQKAPQLAGRVVVKLVIDRSGSVAMVGDAGSSVGGDVLACEQHTFKGLRFPAPEAGIVTAVVPLTFASD